MGFNWNYFLFRTEIQINQINSSFEHRLHRLKGFFSLALVIDICVICEICGL